MRRWSLILLASSLWTLYVWITRTYNIARGTGTPAFKAVHYALAVISILFGLAVGWIGLKLLKR